MPAPPLELSAPMTALELLGTPLLLTDYRGLDELCRQWARAGACVALDFANTQIVTMRRHEPWFRDLTSVYDCFPPDGMPLIWCLRLAGARLRDRVYGPTFMRQFLTSAPAESTHYLLGGSAACGSSAPFTASARPMAGWRGLPTRRSSRRSTAYPPTSSGSALARPSSK